MTQPRCSHNRSRSARCSFGSCPLCSVDTRSHNPALRGLAFKGVAALARSVVAVVECGMATSRASLPNLRYVVEHCSDPYQSELGYFFHIREMKRTDANGWVPALVHGHTFDGASAKRAA